MTFEDLVFKCMGFFIIIYCIATSVLIIGLVIGAFLKLVCGW